MKELKSFLSLNLAIIMLLTMLFPVPAIAVNSDVPESAIEETVTATEGSEPIVDRDFNNGKMHYTISADGVLTITGTGAMQNYSSADHAPWYTYRAQVKKIVVEDGITTIGEYAFAEMNAVTSVTLPEGIEEIPLYAFYNCSALRTIDLPESVTTFGDYAFCNCQSLQRITIPEGVTALSNSLFRNCRELEEITLPSTFQKLGNNLSTFNNTSIVSIYFNGTLEDWLNISFNSNSLPMTKPCNLYINGQLLSCLNIPDGILKIPAYAFQYVNLTSAKLPDSVTSVGANAFYNCKQLGSVMLTDRMTEVEMNAFADCTALSKIFYIGDESSWESITINSGNSRLNDATHFYLSAESDVSIISVADTEHGSVTVSDSFCYPGDVVTVTAQPEVGYRLKRILVNGQEIEGNTFTIDADTKPDEYLVVEKIEWKHTAGSFDGYALADVVLADGTTQKNVTIAYIGNNPANNYGDKAGVWANGGVSDNYWNNSAYYNHILTYSANDNGSYNIDMAHGDKTINLFDDTNATITKGKATISTATNIYVATDKTVFLLADDPGEVDATYTAYVGKKNVPSIENATLCILTDSNGYAVLVVASDYGDEGSNFVAYVTDGDVDLHHRTLGDGYFIYKLGETSPTTVWTGDGKLDYQNTGLYSFKIDSNGTISEMKHLLQDLTKDGNYSMSEPILVDRVAIKADELGTSFQTYGYSGLREDKTAEDFGYSFDPGAAIKDYNVTDDTKVILVTKTAMDGTAVLEEGSMADVKADSIAFVKYTAIGRIYNADVIYVFVNTGFAHSEPADTYELKLEAVTMDCTKGAEIVASLTKNGQNHYKISQVNDVKVKIYNADTGTEVYSTNVQWTQNDGDDNTVTISADATLTQGSNYYAVVTLSVNADGNDVTATLRTPIIEAQSIIKISVKPTAALSNDYDESLLTEVNDTDTFAEVVDLIQEENNASTLKADFQNSMYAGHRNAYDLNAVDAYGLNTYSGAKNYVVSAEFEQYMDVNNSGTCGDNIEWTLDEDGTLTLTGSGDMPYYNYNRYPWYSYHDEIKNIVVSDGITSVANEAFANDYTRVINVTLANSVTRIGYSAFHNCTALETLSIGGAITNMGSPAFGGNAFEGCTSLATVYVDEYAVLCGEEYERYLPSSATIIYKVPESDEVIQTWYIGTYDETDVEAELHNNGALFISGTGTFRTGVWPNGKITSVVVSDGITSIPNDTFSGAKRLKSVTLGKDIQTIGQRAFYNCTALESINLPEGITSIEYSTFANCGALQQINLPEGVTQILGYAFDGCKSLTELNLPENLNRIEFDAFRNCSGIHSIVIPDSVGQIGSSAFYGCSGLETLTVGKNVTWIGSNAFACCLNLRDVQWNVKSCNIGSYLFATSGDEEEGLTLAVGADVISIPEKLFYISSNDTGSKNQLKAVMLEKNSVLEQICASAFYGCNMLENVDLGDKLTYIGDAAFNSCSALTSIELPDSLEYIGRKAFFRTGLTAVTVGSNVHHIGELAFAQCPDKLVMRGYTGSAAERYANENSITFELLDQVLLNLSGNRSDIDYERTVGYRVGTDAPLSWYSQQAQAAYYAIASDANLIAWNTLSDGTGTSYGKDDAVTMSKDMALYAQWTPAGCSLLDEDNRNANGILFTLNDEAKTAYVGDGSSMNNNSGYYGSPEGGAVTIPNTVTKDDTVYQVIGIGANAFRGSEQITSVSIGTNVSSVVPSAFEGCPNLQAFEVAEGNKSFSARDGVLYDAEGLYLYLYPGGKTDTAFTVPESVKTIGRSAFYDNTYLESLTVGRSVTAIYRNAFCGLDHLTEITLPFIGVRELDGDDGYYSPCFSEVFDFGWYYGSPISTEQLSRYNSSGYWSHNTTVGGGLIKVTILGGPLYQGAFAGCSGIEEINLPSVPETIPDECFSGCSALQKLNFANQNAYAQEGRLILPEGVQSIGERAFYGCQSITGVFIPNSLTDISDSAFIASGVEEFTVSLGNERYSADKWGVLYNKDQTELLLYPACRRWPYYNVADTATRIGPNAFNGSETLINLYVPKTVTDLDDGAIVNCPNLTVCCYMNSAAYYYALEHGVTAWYLDNQTLQGISVYSLPERLTQVQGREDWSGLYVVGSYGDKELQIDEYTLSFDRSTSGVKTVTVEYQGMTDTFEIIFQTSTLGNTIAFPCNAQNLNGRIALIAVYDARGAMLTSGTAAVVNGEAQLRVSDKVLADAVYAKLFILDGQTYAPVADAQVQTVR